MVRVMAQVGQGVMVALYTPLVRACSFYPQFLVPLLDRGPQALFFIVGQESDDTLAVIVRGSCLDLVMP